MCAVLVDHAATDKLESPSADASDLDGLQPRRARVKRFRHHSAANMLRVTTSRRPNSFLRSTSGRFLSFYFRYSNRYRRPVDACFSSRESACVRRSSTTGKHSRSSEAGGFSLPRSDVRAGRASDTRTRPAGEGKATVKTFSKMSRLKCRARRSFPLRWCRR